MFCLFFCSFYITFYLVHHIFNCATCGYVFPQKLITLLDTLYNILFPIVFKIKSLTKKGERSKRLTYVE